MNWASKEFGRCSGIHEETFVFAGENIFKLTRIPQTPCHQNIHVPTTSVYIQLPSLHFKWQFPYYRHTQGTILTGVQFKPSKRIQYLPSQTQTDELLQKYFIRNVDWIFQFDQVFLIPASLESMCLINSSLQSLTLRYKLMSAFVWVRKQTKGKANLAIIISNTWNQIERASERGRDRQRKWRKKTEGILVIIYNNSK